MSDFKFDLDNFSTKIQKETDISCAILGASLLDAMLEELFKKQLKCFINELLNGMGPLSTFSSKIRLGCALGWFDDNVRGDLDIIRGIRNDFAHGYNTDLSFTDQSISARCSNLKTTVAFLKGYDDYKSCEKRALSSGLVDSMKNKFLDPRWKYQISVEFLYQYLDDMVNQNEQYSSEKLFQDIANLSKNTLMNISN